MTTGLLLNNAQECLITLDAVEFLSALHRQFEPRRQECLSERELRQRHYDRGDFPDFPAASQPLRETEWMAAPPPADLRQQLVSACGAPDGDALGRGLDSGASTFVADFDDRTSPTWDNCLEGHENLRRACDALDRHPAQSGARRRPVLLLRPRNWSLNEKHFPVDGSPISASLFDFGCFFFHNARTLLGGNTAPYFSLPKLESPLEARLWRDIFRFAEQQLGIPYGSVRANITIETLSAVFAMEEILFELREYAMAMECSPANYLASFAKACRANGESLLPQRDDLSMDQPFLHAYQELLVHTCHKRGVLALSAAVPQFTVGAYAARNPFTQSTITARAKREIEMGFDGICVSDIELVPFALREVERCTKARPGMRGMRSHCYISSRDLFSRAFGRITMDGLRENIESTLEYLQAWLTGRGCLRCDHGLDSMATAELCRAQLWQWVRHSVRIAGGRKVDRYLVERLVAELLAATEGRLGERKFAASKYRLAADLLLRSCTGNLDFPLTVHGYAYLN